MSPLPLLVAFCLLIVLASLLGGWLPALVRLTHTRMQLMMSFVAGLMLGVGVLHLLPHAVAELQSIDRAVGWMLFGLLLMFFLIRIFHFHQHGPAATDETAVVTEPPHDHAHEHDHGQKHHHHHHHADHGPTKHRLSWLGVAFGLALHTLIDGLALGASVVAEARDGEPGGWRLFGLGTFLAVALHKPLDALSITTLMAAGGWPPRARQFVNAGFALMCPLGALVFYFGMSELTAQQHLLLGSALAFSAGVFVCISLADLLPELSFHTHDRFKLSFALLLGVLLAYGIGFLEPAHTHGGHNHGGHDHAAHDEAHHDHAGHEHDHD